MTTLDYYGEGGLAEAIANANAAPDVDVITFGVTGTIVVPETVWLQYSTIIHGAGITLTSGPEFVEGALLLVQRYEADTNVSSIDGLTIQTTEFFVDGINATNVDLTLSSVTLSGTGVFADDTQLHADQSLIDSSANTGIAVDGYSSTLAMTSSTIRGSGGAAIWVAYIESMEISSSTISGSGHSGVRVEYVDSVTITDSQITGNGHVAPTTAAVFISMT